MITKNMTINEILRRYPETIEVFRRYGLDCYDCQIADFEQLEYGATKHKIDIESLLADLNSHTKR